MASKTIFDHWKVDFLWGKGLFLKTCCSDCAEIKGGGFVHDFRPFSKIWSVGPASCSKCYSCVHQILKIGSFNSAGWTVRDVPDVSNFPCSSACLLTSKAESCNAQINVTKQHDRQLILCLMLTSFLIIVVAHIPRMALFQGRLSWLLWMWMGINRWLLGGMPPVATLCHRSIFAQCCNCQACLGPAPAQPEKRRSTESIVGKKRLCYISPFCAIFCQWIRKNCFVLHFAVKIDM